MKTIQEEIQNLKQSAWTLSVAEENGGFGQVKFRSEEYVTLSLAIATAERIVKHSDQQNKELREENAKVKHENELLNQINWAMSIGRTDQATVPIMADIKLKDAEIQRLTKEVELLNNERMSRAEHKRMTEELTRLRELLDRMSMTLEIYNTGEDANIVTLLSEYNALNHKP